MTGMASFILRRKDEEPISGHHYPQRGHLTGLLDPKADGTYTLNHLKGTEETTQTCSLGQL